MTYQIPLELPEGFSGATPRVALRYNSMAGTGELGIGWRMPIPHVERFTARGLPRYGTEDVFAADGSEELVRVSTADLHHTYRARFEGSFVRYKWHSDAVGEAGYWEAEYPDGRRAFFGATSDGTPVIEARVTHPNGGVFRYMLVEMLDTFGHHVRYDYALHGSDSDGKLPAAYPLLVQISYLFAHEATGQAPRYRVAFGYEKRADVVSSALAGFDLRLDQRLRSVTVHSDVGSLRRYALTYEEVTGALSRLVSVEQYGLDNALSQLRFSFWYSPSLDFAREGGARPFLYSMGQLDAGPNGGVDLQNGHATLIDINGDALPDILDTGYRGQHRFFLNKMAPDGTQSFSEPQSSSATPAEGSHFVLGAPGVQAVDLDGDGFTDLLHAASGEALCNDGAGDWALTSQCRNGPLLAEFLDDAGDSDPRGMRFFDYDGDKRIDLLHTLDDRSANVWHNTPGGFAVVPLRGLGRTFDAGRVQLADVNGDNLLDPVDVTASGVWYRLNLGFGTWGSPVLQPLAGATEAAVAGAELQDLNGDGLDDLVIVQGNSVSFALNRAGAFQRLETLSSDKVEGGLPAFQNSTTVLFADMNGSGSTDVVWLHADGTVHVLDFLAMRPNLLTRIENGIGGAQLVEYGTSAQQQARDQASGTLWRHRLPLAMSVVTADERYTTLTPDIRQRTERAYSHGFYDGRERGYRGFERVDEWTPGDESQEAGHTVFDYDVGASDVYRQGKLVREQIFDGEATPRRLQRVMHLYEDCPLADVPSQGLRVGVRHVCETSTETLLQEGRPEPDWVTLRQRFTYDAYGNVSLSENLGVVGMGPSGEQGCAPCDAPPGTHSGACGAQCLGDEAFTKTEHIGPGVATGGKWIIGKPSRTISYGEEGGEFTEVVYCYDGAAFVGLEPGRLTAGLQSRVCTRISPQAQAKCEGDGWVYSARAEHDAHGNVVTELDPLGSADDLSGHRRRIEYDGYGLKPTAVELFLGADGQPYRLRREVQYDRHFDAPESITRWMLRGAKVASERGETRMAYDAFGRRSKLAAPGDSLEAPTHEFLYELSAPTSRIVARSRSRTGGPEDVERVQCIDGLGRAVQTRTRLSQGLYQVSGFHEVNPHGLPVRVFQGYQGGAECEPGRPQGVPFTRYDYDALNRKRRVTAPDGDLHTLPSVSTVEYAPLSQTVSEADDNDPQSPAYKTPYRTYTDGLGRVTRLERELVRGAKPGVVRALWDSLGRLSGYVDAAGSRKHQSYDQLGRVVQVDDPNAGVTRFIWDAAGNQVGRSDARGKTVNTVYDGANRATATFDAADRAATEVQTRYDFNPSCAACTHAEGKAITSSYPLGGDRGRAGDEHSFDLRGRETRVARSLEGHTFVTTTEYDNLNRAQRLRYPDGTVIEQEYDGASRLVAISGVVDSVKFDSRGLLSEVYYSNGTKFTQTHDTLQRPRMAMTYGLDDKPLLGFGYDPDRMGNLLGIRDLSDGGSNGRADVTFVHDAWHRVTEARFGGDGEVLAFGFDALDNITRKESSLGALSKAHVGAYRYDVPNAVSQAGQLDLEYDAAGSMTQRGDTALSWDYQGRLQRIETGEGHATEYLYGGGLDRVMELGDGGVTYFLGPNFEVRDGVAVTYARMGQRRVARLSNTSMGTAVLSDYNDNMRIDVGDAWLAHKRGAPWATQLRGSARRALVPGSK